MFGVVGGSLGAVSGLAQVVPTPTDLTIDSELPLILDWDAAVTIVDTGEVAGSTTLREHDDIVHDPDDPNLGTYPEREFKFYFSAVISGTSRVWVATSADRSTWSAPVACTISGGDFVGEDPSITQVFGSTPKAYRDGSDYLWLYCENNTSNEIDVYRSTDGFAWTLQQASVIPKASGWEAYLTGSPCARHDGTQFVIGYEGINALGGSQREAFGIASGVSATSLAKSANNPVLHPDDIPEADISIVVDSMWLTADGARVIATAHDGAFSTTASMFRFSTTVLDPTTWDNGDITLIGDRFIDPAVIRSDLTADTYGRTHLVTNTSDRLAIKTLPLKSAWVTAAEDTFTRADSSSLGTTETGALPWSKPSGDMQITGGKLTGATDSIGNRATVDPGVSDVRLSATVHTSPASNRIDTGLIVRRQDASNEWVVMVTKASGTNVFRLGKRVAGSITWVATATGVIAENTSYRVQVACFGAQITATLDGGSTLTTIDSTFRTATVCGINIFRSELSDDGGSTWDDVLLETVA